MTKILLVEDDKSLREIYGVRLLAEGYDIVSAGDGEEALAMAIKEKPQLIVSDVMMPKISGFDMLDILRSTTETRNIKVIMMTALSSEEQRTRGEQLGADRYLVKSQVGIEDVVRAVHEVLDGTAPAPAAPAATPTPAPAAEPVTAPVATPAPAVVAPEPVAPPVVEPVIATPAPAVPDTVAMPTGPGAVAMPAAPAATPNPAPAAEPVVTPVATPAPATVAPEPVVVPVTTPAADAGPEVATPRATLGDRVIQPIERPVETGPDMAERLTQELTDTTSIFSGAPTVPAPPAPPSSLPLPDSAASLSLDQNPGSNPTPPAAS